MVLCRPGTPNDTTSCPTIDASYTYDLNSNRASLVDPLTQTTSFTYDALNRLTFIDYSGAVSGTSSTSDVTYTYDPNGNRHSMADTATTNYCYDELDRLTSTSTSSSSCPASGSAIQTGYRYDLDGNRSATIYPGGSDRVTYTYDAADRLQRMADWTATSPSCSGTPTTGTTCYTYVPDSRLATVANHNETTTTYTWDNARRLQDILHMDGTTNTLSHHGFTLDSLGNRTHFDEQLPVVSGEAGEFGGGMVAQQLTSGASTADAAQLDDFVAATTDAAQPVKPDQTTPSAAVPRAAQPNKSLALDDTSTSTERTSLFHAEPTGHKLDVFDKKSATANIQVQHAGSQTSIRFELPGTAQQRAALGNRAVAQVGDVNVTWTSFDDHLKEDIVLAKQPSTNSITFNVQMKGLGFAKDDKGGWLLVDAGGHPHFYLQPPTVKDAAGKSGSAALDLTVDKATLTVDRTFLADATYPITIDPTINYVLNTVGTAFTYDHYAPVSQLTRAAAEQSPHGQSDYTFDAVRNRTQLIQGPLDPTDDRPTSTYTYDRADRLTSVLVTPHGSTTGTTFNYTWDANGNLKARSGGSVSDSFGYDQANRLTSGTVTGRGSGTYTYDGDGKRTSKTVSSVTTNYVWDVAGGLPRLLSDGVHRYVWGAQGLAYNVAISGGAVGTYHADQIGSIREITSSDGSIHTAYLTDEYGNRTTVQGTDDQPFQFTGELFDPETGFVFLRARYYEPQTGRFLTRDRTGGAVISPETLNHYGYVGNDPINHVDPSGNDSDCPEGFEIDCETAARDYGIDVPQGAGISQVREAQGISWRAIWSDLLNAVGLEEATTVASEDEIALEAYNKGGGHHIPAKSMFRGVPGYDPDAVLAVPNSELERLAIDHNAITGAQARLYKSFAATGQSLTWEQVYNIEVEALVAGGAEAGAARQVVADAIRALLEAGISGPARIPWGGS